MSKWVGCDTSHQSVGKIQMVRYIAPYILMFGQMSLGAGLDGISSPSELAKENFSTADGLCWLVDFDKGWPSLARPVRHLPLDTYKKASDAIFTVALAESAAPKPKVGKDTWDCLRAVYQLDEGSASVILNRLSPAVLFQSPGRKITLTSKAGPEYVAFSRDGKPVVHPTTRLEDLSAEAFSMDEPWILVWFAGSAPSRAHVGPHDVENDRGVSKSLSGFNKPPDSVDVPVLLRLEHKVDSVRWDKGRGLTLNFRKEIGKLAIMPLGGGRLFLPEETKRWSEGLPAPVAKECRDWSNRLKNFPVGVVESFVADPDRGKVTVSQNFRWSVFEDDWESKSVKAAPVPPMLALAFDSGVPVKFLSKGEPVKPVDCDYMYTAGLAMAVENVDEYEYEISDLDNLLHVPDRKSIPTEPDAKLLQEKLERHVAQMVEAGHLSPLLYIYGGIGGTWFSHFYWATSSETAQALAMAHPYLSEPLQGKVVNYLRNEWAMNPPFRFDRGRYKSGMSRAAYELPWQDMDRQLSYAFNREAEYRQSDYLFSLYGVEAYFRLTGEKPDPGLRKKATGLVMELLRKQDWAIMGPARLRDIRDRHALFYYNLQGAATYNRWLAGAIGFTRLARRYGWEQEEKLGCYLVAKLAMARVAQAHYLKAMYRRGLVRGKLEDDNRALLHVDTGSVVIGRGPIETGVHQNQEIPPFNDLVEEVGRLLGRYAASQCRVYLDHLDYSLPLWYISEAPKQQATEHRTSPLQCYNGNVLAQYWILGKRREDFTRYIDVTRFVGDLYYIQNLAAGIDSYRL